jgi:hypothetical protein
MHASRVIMYSVHHLDEKKALDLCQALSGDIFAENRAITLMFGVAASKVLAQSLLTRPSIFTTRPRMEYNTADPARFPQAVGRMRSHLNQLRAILQERSAGRWA